VSNKRSLKTEQLAISNWQLAKPLYRFATLCRPDTKKEKSRLKLSAVGGLKNEERRLRPLGHRSVELHFGVCLQQNAYGGWVYG
jgi:hypothetical protein